MIDFKALAAPFSPASVSWRIGSTTTDKTKGMALAYLDARDVMDRLDAVCTPGGWQATYPHALQKTVCSIGILCGDHWVWKSNGAGDSDIEAEKGALSDAFKRAAVLWGVGRYLYNLPSPWVEIETRGRSSIIKEHEYAKLAAVLAKHSASLGQSGILDDAVRQNTTQGLAPKAPTKNDTALQAKTWADAAIGQIEMIRAGREIDAWFDANSRALEKLETVHPDQFKRIEAAATKHRDDIGARLQ